MLTPFCDFNSICGICSRVYDESWSAKRIVDDELGALKDKYLGSLMENLHVLAPNLNGDQLTFLLRKVFKAENDAETFGKYFAALRRSLESNEDIQDIFVGIYFEMEQNEGFFNIFLESSHLLPHSLLQDLLHKTKREAEFRSHLANSEGIFENPLSWMNPCLESAEEIPDQFKSAMKKTPSRRWLLELMGQIRALSRQGKSYSNLFRIFEQSLILFSEVDLFLTSNNVMCVESVRILLTSSWPQFSAQLSEWMLQMIKDNDEQTKSKVIECFPAFKGAEKYNEATMWSRVVPIFCEHYEKSA